MKIDRLIGIALYLLNRDVATARELAERFEVVVKAVASKDSVHGLQPARNGGVSMTRTPFN